MKKFLLTLFIAPMLSCAQEAVSALTSGLAAPFGEAIHTALQNPAAPLAALDHFANHHPDTRAIWGVRPNEFSARYKDPHTGLTSVNVYDGSGHLLRQEAELDDATIPPAITAFLMKKLPGKKISVWSCVEANELSYYARCNSRIYWFGASGAYSGSHVNWFRNEKIYM